MSTDGYLPEAAINADPPSLSDSGLPPNTPDGTDATADAPGSVEGPVEGAEPAQGADPDLITDDDREQKES